jgi:hypothetical protein
MRSTGASAIGTKGRRCRAGRGGRRHQRAAAARASRPRLTGQAAERRGRPARLATKRQQTVRARPTAGGEDAQEAVADDAPAGQDAQADEERDQGKLLAKARVRSAADHGARRRADR